MVALGIDPGEHSGIVLVDTSRPRWKLIESHLLGDLSLGHLDNFTEFVLTLEQLLEYLDAESRFPDVICVENFDKRTYGDLFADKLVGAVWSLGARWDVPVISPYPKTTKAVSDKLILEYIDHDLISHERDALRCVVAAIGADLC